MSVLWSPQAQIASYTKLASQQYTAASPVRFQRSQHRGYFGKPRVAGAGPLLKWMELLGERRPQQSGDFGPRKPRTGQGDFLAQPPHSRSKAGSGPAASSSGGSARAPLAASPFSTLPLSSVIPGDTPGWVAMALLVVVGIAAAVLGKRLRDAARQARHERQRFRTVFANTEEGVIVTDSSGRIDFLNPAAERLTGWVEQDALGKELQSVLHVVDEQTRQQLPDVLVRALREEQVTALGKHTILIGRDAAERAIEGSAAPIRGGQKGITGVILVFRDDSETRRLEAERRQAMEDLRRSEERFRMVAQATNDGLWDSDLERGTVWSNEAFDKLVGPRSKEGVCGQWWVDRIHPEDRERVTTSVQAALAGDKANWVAQYRFQRNDGSYATVLDRAFIARDQSGKATRCVGALVDFTELSNTEKALRESQLRFRAVADNAPAAIFIKDLDGRYLLANPQTCEALGVPGDLMGQTDHDVLPAEVADSLCEHDREVIASGHATEREEVVRTGENERTFLAVKFPLRNSQGQIEGVCGVAVDITARKRAEVALRESEEMFRLMSNSIPQPAWMARPDGHVFWYNQRWYDYTGATAQEMDGWGWQSIHDPQELPRVLAGWKAAIARGNPWEDTFPLRRHDGTMRWHLSRAVPVKDERGRVMRWFGTNTDITERKRTEGVLQFLADASESLSTLVDYKSTLQKVARLAVPAFADWCAVDMLEADGSLQRVAVAHVDPAKVELAEKFYEHRPPQPDDPHGVSYVWRTGQSELVEEITDEFLRNAAENQQHFRILRGLDLKSYMCVPLTVRGKQLGVLTFVAAESERRYGPDDLKVAEDLAHRAAITIENARLYQELKDADRRKDEFLAMLAHELRNPLAPIRSGLDVLAMDPGQQQETIELMQRQVEHLVRLVDDLLDVSRIMRGKVELRNEAVELAKIFERSVEAVRRTVQQQDQELIVSIPDQPIWLHADPVRLTQVLENLLNNACKYSDRGGRIELTAQRQDGQAVIRVWDNGMGIEPELLSNVFDLFSQSSRSLDRSQGGLGIGLTLVKNLVELHDGSISAYSEGLGQGSEFVLRLPLGEEAEQREAPEPEPVAAGSRNILIVDDNVEAAQMLRLLLSKLASHTIDTAYEGQLALQKVDQSPPDIVLLDIGLPTIDGYEVARQIRSRSEYDGVLLVALTGYGQADDRRKSREAGFDEHLVKPPSTREIQNVLKHPKLSSARLRQPKALAAETLPSQSVRQKPESLPTQQLPISRPLQSENLPADLLRQAAHELGNSTHVMVLCSELLKRDAQQPTREKVSKMLTQLVAATTKLTQGLRLAGRAAGSVEVRPSSVELQALIGDSLATVREEIEQRGLQCELRLPDVPVPLEGAPDLLKEAMVELVRNAARYTDAGGCVRLSAETDGGFAVLRVQDTGAGMPPELLHRVFEPYVRGENRLDFAEGHLGVGLTLVRRIVESHGGTIAAQSQPGQGSQFTVRLPLSRS